MTCCAFCQEEFELNEDLILVRRARIGFGDRSGNLTYLTEGEEEEPVHPGCLGPYMIPDEEAVLREIVQTEVEMDVGMAFLTASELMDDSYEPEPPDEGFREPRRRRSRR